jgi:formate dehydrogenase major subunit
VPGLGTSYGRGGATTFAADLQHSDAVLIMGSNMAECHPVAFRWVMKAKTRDGNRCKLIHADPRFTRTSAMADIYAPLRAGTDIILLGALIRHVVEFLQRIIDKPAAERTPRERFFHDYLLHYTNAATLITEEYRDTERENADDPEQGLFAGFQANDRRYDPSKWRYETPARAAQPADPPATFAEAVRRNVGPHPHQDPSLRNPRCVFQVLKKHFSRYTPDLVRDMCGTPVETFQQVADTLLENAGPDRSGAICYAVGWTQHTTGVQIIRAAAVLQLLLGNVGRPGGGILALRGHATIQGSTDIATLYNIHPGYLNTPDARKNHNTLMDYIGTETAATATSFWSNFPAFIVSQLKAWFGAAATPQNEYGFRYLPRIVGDHSHMPMMVAMSEGKIDGFFAMGQNPAVGGQNASLQRKALAKLKWLVVRDLYETETASFWKDSPEVKRGELVTGNIQTEVFFLPAAGVPEMDGSFTNTQRLVQWHDKAVDPPGDARSDSWFTYHLGKRLQTLYDNPRDRDDPRHWAIRNLVWDYEDAEENRHWDIKDEPSAARVMKEINGYRMSDRRPLAAFADIKDDGTTACGAWIYTGIFAPDAQHPNGVNRAASRVRDDWTSLGWGFAWPANRRLMYNRASANLQGQPWDKERRLAQDPIRRARNLMGYVYWDPDRVRPDGQRGMWVGFDVPDFVPTKAPTAAATDGVGLAWQDGKSPFIMNADGKGRLFVPAGLVDGPLPTHYEPYESPVHNLIYRRQEKSPVAIRYAVPGNVYAEIGSSEFPHVLSTYRLTEHHLSGTMSRWLPWLAELQPELFCEISPEHAEILGVRSTDFVVISTPRGSIRAKALVTRRIRPFVLRERTLHHVGLPWHWGYKGIAQGDVVNDLTALVGDPNVNIHEAKVFVCNVTKAV